MRMVYLLLWLFFAKNAFAGDTPAVFGNEGLLAVLTALYISIRDAVSWYRNYKSKS